MDLLYPPGEHTVISMPECGGSKGQTQDKVLDVCGLCMFCTYHSIPSSDTCVEKVIPPPKLSFSVHAFFNNSDNYTCIDVNQLGVHKLG